MSVSSDEVLNSGKAGHDDLRVLSPKDTEFSDDENESGKKKKSKKPSKKKEAVVEDSFGGFGDEPDFDDDTGEKKVIESKIHIRIQQRNGKKTVTTMAGLDPKFDFKKMTKYFRTTFGCIGKVVSDEEHGEIIQLSGDHRAKLKEFLVGEKIAAKGDIVVHGF
ncbi:Eukaryotic translation initiation factor eIF-1 [Coemansia erecta]|uniref:Eukaryotic translation initiation factor eIF-1 n=1 Tax=Coemansia erecta TaxID=147472 RepID=A0A9W8CQX9_9FUNG|nr:Eukaryotic translation initiation factor eIF-1 [Coemansia erecta]